MFLVLFFAVLTIAYFVQEPVYGIICLLLILLGPLVQAARWMATPDRKLRVPDMMERILIGVVPFFGWLGIYVLDFYLHALPGLSQEDMLWRSLVPFCVVGAYYGAYNRAVY
ncbi:hypothetical protein CYG49_03100 [Candidatus Saccharibacteria bacterium]|nr:MAG: hypothetical protein CYG49_03100 [Candidatus Saccharibacteria bacterium]